MGRMFGSEDEDLGMDKSHYYSLTSHSKPDKGKNRKFELDTDSVSEGAEEAFFDARTEWEEEVTGRWNDMST
ncbi:hypothetical protein SLS56_010245 [Neofusicoccum ribis]|uniref:Uncharacterized protein n=1 Tax=Neofusicoccum ribis TaxID=45134 RepID=A0ABR3SFY4_9PEZI